MDRRHFISTTLAAGATVAGMSKPAQAAQDGSSKILGIA